jgi:hypothetical protein
LFFGRDLSEELGNFETIYEHTLWVMIICRLCKPVECNYSFNLHNMELSLAKGVMDLVAFKTKPGVSADAAAQK